MRDSRPRRQPLVGIVLAAVLGLLVADGHPHSGNVLLALIVAASVVSLRWPTSLGTYCLVASAAFALHSSNIVNSPGKQLADRVGNRSRPATAEGTVVSEPKITGSGFATFLLRLTHFELEGVRGDCHATISVRWRGRAEFGDTLILFGMAEPIPPTQNPGEFDMRAYLARRDVRTQLFARYAENGSVLRHGSGNVVLAAAQATRRWMQSTLAAGLADSADVQGMISGMVLGVRHETPEDIEEPFQQTGTLHLFAVAGLHVGIVAQLLWIVAATFRIPRKWATALIIPALLFYAAITGLHTSSVRAAVMSSVLLAGYFAERKVLALNSLAAAALLILLYDTQELFAVGFQLSFCVVAAIIIAADPIANFLRPASESDPFLPRSLLGPLRRLSQHVSWWTIRATSVSLAAWAGSLIPIIVYFNLVTPVALLANLAVVPIAFFVLAVAMLTLIAAPFSSAAALVFTNANWSLCRLIAGIVQLFAHVPAGHFYVEHPHWPVTWNAEITVLDLAPGAAVHVRTSKTDWIIDAGSARDYDRVLCPYLHLRGIDRLDGLVVSHGDSQHIGGASSVIHDFHPRTIVDSTAPDRSKIHNGLIAQLRTMNFDRTLRVAGDEVALGPKLSALVLFPPRGFSAKRSDDQALILQLAIAGGYRVLLMSDSGVTTERALVGSGSAIRTDLLVKGQHHSEPSGSAEFLDAAAPAAIVASSRDFPRNERIPEEWAGAIEARGVPLFRQDQTGAVTVRFFDDHWEATSHREGKAFRSSSR